MCRFDMYKFKSLICVLLVFLTSVFPFAVHAIGGDQHPPKLLNLFLGYLITDDDVHALAKWDIVVLDMDQQFQFPEKVRHLRELNPKIKILAYVSASEISDARFRGDPTSPGYKLANALSESWFMHRADGERAFWWQGTSLMNATDLGSPVDGQRWNTFLGPFIQNELMSSGLWDGVFLDAAYGDLTTTFGSDLDPDQDHLANPSKQTDEAWRAGMIKLIKNVRASIGPDKLIMNNSSGVYSGWVNGTLYENFSRFGWAWPFHELRSSLDKNVVPKISAINTNTNNQEQPGNYRLMRYGLASALVADAYYSFDAGDSGHQRTWWYDEYDAPIGSPRGTPRIVRGPTQGAYPSVWSRTYERGAVFVNSTAKAETIVLPGEFEKLTGTQDPFMNDGSIINKITVPPQDGVVLLRRSEAAIIRDAEYLNGTFVQVYDAQGKRLRNGFFASRDDVPGGVNVLVSDVDRDGLDDTVWSQDGRVNVRFGRGGSTSFRPYGNLYHGLIEIAAGQTNRDAPWELVLSPSDEWPAKILVTNLRGQVLRSWFAYRQEFTGGSTVGLGDVDGDGLREVVTGAGRGGGPHVRIFRTDGASWGGAFFAFDPNERGGVNVAIGDVDGDGRQEIVVGSGRGSVPRVRVYDGRGILKSEFVLGNAPSPVGVKPIVSDIDGDGKAEILIPGNPF